MGGGCEEKRRSSTVQTDNPLYSFPHGALSLEQSASFVSLVKLLIAKLQLLHVEISHQSYHTHTHTHFLQSDDGFTDEVPLIHIKSVFH